MRASWRTNPSSTWIAWAKAKRCCLPPARAYRADESAVGAHARGLSRGDYEPVPVPAARAFYPSDQMGFKKSLAMASLTAQALLLARRWAASIPGAIPCWTEKNIEYIVEGLLRLTDR